MSFNIATQILMRHTILMCKLVDHVEKKNIQKYLYILHNYSVCNQCNNNKKKMKQEKEKEIVAPKKLTNSITMADDG